MSSYPRSGSGSRGRRPEVEESHNINHRITAREVRVILADGEQAGVITLSEALRLADESGLDLVEVSPNAKPPVCRLMDYGKFKYREQKKEAQAKKKRSETGLKELRIRYRTDSGDLETKLKHAQEFLAEGDKVKFSMRFKGREVMYGEMGAEMFNEIIERLKEVAVVDERSPTGGRQMFVVFAPKK